MVCQQLCRTSHSYKITLQFSLWDFLRDLGENNVGGVAVVKNVKEDDDFGVKIISDTRLRNIAKAYAWWIAKDSVTLAVLKVCLASLKLNGFRCRRPIPFKQPVDFTVLKPRTREFLKELFTQIFVNSQRPTPLVTSDLKNTTFTSNRNAIEEIFNKASRIQALAIGISYFLTEAFKDKSDPEDGFLNILRWAISVTKDILRAGVDNVPSI
jgi:nucleolar MIF4G domain-containing protein 1